ncbi:MAG TPA: hypothetical protein VFW92_10440 [Candidatus Limnocylindrales bacterium]|nr:hypothetical protein [Candidatus Limnocylindrales bacterium]
MSEQLTLLEAVVPQPDLDERDPDPTASPPRDAAPDRLLLAGPLEQTCPDCGRWEAAGSYCSWCGRPMDEADHYRNAKGDGDERERSRHRPTTAPANPPPEYRDTKRAWPEAWGPWPGVERGPRQTRRPVAHPDDPRNHSNHHPDGNRGVERLYGVQ